jgi:hypothetical protein
MQYFVKILSCNSAVIYKFFDVFFIFMLVRVDAEHVKKSTEQQPVVVQCFDVGH